MKLHSTNLSKTCASQVFSIQPNSAWGVIFSWNFLISLQWADWLFRILKLDFIYLREEPKESLRIVVMCERVIYSYSHKLVLGVQHHSQVFKTIKQLNAETSFCHATSPGRRSHSDTSQVLLSRQLHNILEYFPAWLTHEGIVHSVVWENSKTSYAQVLK